MESRPRKKGEALQRGGEHLVSIDEAHWSTEGNFPSGKMLEVPSILGE
ncbi:Hypothetical protein (plasmid) [Pseudomonas putida]|nr:Hypothetical protein [Pseudomonas putida]